MRLHANNRVRTEVQHSIWCGLLGLASCISAPSISAPSHPQTPFASAEPFLADGAAARLDRWVRIARTGPARWWPEGDDIQPFDGTTFPASDGTLPTPRAVPVVAETHDHVRVLLDDESVRAVVWIARSALFRVPVAPTPVSPDFEGPGGVELEPGAVVALGELRDGRRRVTSGRSSVDFVGWIDDRSLGETFVSRPTGALRIDGRLAAATPVLAAIGGEPIATLHATDVTRAADGPPGYVSIVWTSLGIAVHGLVASADFAPAAGPATRWDLEDAAGSVATLTDTPFATLRAEAWFYDAPDGHRVGRVKRATLIYAWGRDPVPGTWSGVVLVPVPQLGLVKAFVHTADLAIGFSPGGNG